MNSFTVEPPTVTIDGAKKQLRPYSLGFESKVMPVVASLMENPSARDVGIMSFVAFAVFHSRNPAEASALLADKVEVERLLDLAQHELPHTDIEAIGEYIGGIFTRAEAAQVENAGPAGKPRGEETRPSP
jgi:hypothetical protein